MNFFGFRCIQCHLPLQIARHGLCSRCNKLLLRQPYCGRCGVVLAEYAPLCGQCLNSPPHWDRLVTIGAYQPPLSDYIHHFKFQQQWWLDSTLARLLLLAVISARRYHGLSLPQAILPVPLHPLRQWHRGYNQADLIARRLARQLRLPYVPHWVIRQKHTATQRGLDAKARRQNIADAFALSAAFSPQPYSSIAVIDDVITTGATLNEIAHLVKQQGIQEVQVWGLCKT